MILLFFSMISFFDFWFSFIGLAVRDVMSNKLVRVSDLTVTENFKPNSDLLSFDVSVNSFGIGSVITLPLWQYTLF
ncbi:unnamed protein product [Brassica oleracea var. botrytis]|uniref:(rape) hypothetical protein n=1 Tax=Brassica napus TaxID=3708 RepID=A0A816I5Z6_BRANA|nr:unnamed protein product [Brassica napus]